MTDVGEGRDEEEHDKGADAGNAAQYTKRPSRGDAGALPDGAVAAIYCATVANAARGDGYRELASSISGGGHSCQPEDNHKQIKREYRPCVVGSSA